MKQKSRHGASVTALYVPRFKIKIKSNCKNLEARISRFVLTFTGRVFSAHLFSRSLFQISDRFFLASVRGTSRREASRFVERASMKIGRRSPRKHPEYCARPKRSISRSSLSVTISLMVGRCWNGKSRCLTKMWDARPLNILGETRMVRSFTLKMKNVFSMALAV